VKTSPPHIGTLREKPLHASLKQWCAEPGDRFEVPVDRYVIDVVRDDLLIEVQTGGFSSMRKKLRRLLDLNHRVQVVHPIPVTKTIVRLNDDGEVIGRRKSPKRGTALDVFAELVYITELLDHPGLHIRVVLTTEDEYRRHDPDRAWRRKGWVVQERRLTGVEETIDICGSQDLAAMLPGAIPGRFTTADVTGLTGCSQRIAQQMMYCLRHTEAIEISGKQGNAIEYRKKHSSPATDGADGTDPLLEQRIGGDLDDTLDSAVDPLR
jgi:hypothetical protein